MRLEEDAMTIFWIINTDIIFRGILEWACVKGNAEIAHPGRKLIATLEFSYNRKSQVRMELTSYLQQEEFGKGQQ